MMLLPLTLLMLLMLLLLTLLMLLTAMLAMKLMTAAIPAPAVWPALPPRPMRLRLDSSAVGRGRADPTVFVR